MKSKRGLALAVSGASIGLCGVSVSVSGLAYQQVRPNVGPAVVFDPVIAVDRVIRSLAAAMAVNE